MLRAGQSVIIIGAGVVGVATAYALAKAGLQVTVLDRNMHPAAETSFANGAQLSYAYSESIASPDSLKQLMGWMLRPDSPVILKCAPRNGQFADWVWRFLRAAMPKASLRHSANLLRLGLYSRQMMENWLKALPIAFDHQDKGILYLYRSPFDWQRAQKKVTLGQQFGFEETLLKPEDIAAHEPALAGTAKQFIGAVHSVMDATGDPHLFTKAMAEHCRRELGVQFLSGISVDAALQKNGKVVGVQSAEQSWEADAVVIAAGAFSGGLLQSMRLRLPVQPMKGYSITFDAKAEAAPHSSLSDVSRRLVHTRIGSRVRIAGFAEFAGPNADVRPEPIAQIKRDARALIPGYTFENITEWACLRAATPDGLPVIGPTARDGLWLNTGHGMLGWTQAAGSADLLARLMLGEECPIPMEGYAHARF